MDYDLLGNKIETKCDLLEKELKKHILFDCDLENREKCTAYIDGSFNVQTLTYGFGAVITVDTNTLEVKGSGNNSELAKMRNVTGEILGCMYTIRWCIENGIKHVNIHYDYLGIECWATGRWKAKKEETQEYRDFMKEMIKHIDIEFTKVKSHSGDVRNDRADRLAKDAVGAE